MDEELQNEIEDEGTTSQHREPETERCIVVGVGASAGGTDALEKFFAHIPTDSGLAFVVVLDDQLNPKPATPDYLSQHTRIPVERIEGSAKIEANRIFLAPPGMKVTCADCVLTMVSPDSPEGHAPIDSLFAALAEDQGDHVVCVILSGSGTDGVFGIRAVKEHGGLVIAQSVESAKFGTMPYSAVLTGQVDYVLPVEKIPPVIVEYARHLSMMEAGRGLGGIREEAADYLGEIFTLLRRKTSHDFSRYKQSTVIRRIQRRMQVQQLETVHDYVDRLRRDPKEVELLFRDLLIGVTHFFRDPEAFDVLAGTVIPKLFEDKTSSDYVRIWVVGCATGEEAYSVAMLLCEYTSGMKNSPHVQIFATDIDDRALEIARQARYPESIADHVSAERLERFFTRYGNRYQVAKEIRDMCIFSTHNLINDPPFSRLDLISCRNLLIYLEGSLQKRIVPLFHHALRPAGFLFLGPSESVASHPQLFRAIDKKHRIYRRKSTIVRPPINLPFTEPRRLRQADPVTTGQLAVAREQQVTRSLERILLENYAPASVVINEQHDIIYFSGRTGMYLEPPTGAPSLNILNMARKGLRMDLRAAIHRSITTRQQVTQENVSVEANGFVQRINIIVRPMADLAEESGMLLVIFQEVGPVRTREEAEAEGSMPETENPVVQQLEQELRATKEFLQTAVEELETSNEELKSSNEELLSMNEELQSANEELQTSKEELQSLNEELHTVNHELKEKIEELHRLNDDLQNLFQSTQIATIFLDLELRIKKFTPTTTEVFRLIDSDIGRPIIDIAPRFSELALIPIIQSVLRSGAVIEREVKLTDRDAWYIIRVLPYRTLSNHIDGVVLTFVDITEQKQTQERLELLAAIVQNSDDAIFGKTIDGIVTSWNLGAERLYGYTPEEMIGQPVSRLAPSDRFGEIEQILERIRHGEPTDTMETIRVRRDGKQLYVSLTVSPIHDSTGAIIGASTIARDITDRTLAEIALQQNEERLRFITEALPQLIWISDAEGRLLECNQRWYELTGLTVEETLSGRGQERVVHPDDLARIRSQYPQNVATGTEYLFEYRIRRVTDGAYVWYQGRSRPIRDAEGKVFRWVGTAFDIDERKRTEESLRRYREHFDLAQKAARVGTFEWDIRSERISWTADLEALYGLDEGAFTGTIEHWLDLIHEDDRERVAREMRAARTGDEYVSDFRVRWPDGSVRWLMIRARTYHTGGTAHRMVGANVDVTDRRLAQEELKVSRDRLDLVIDATNLGLWYCDLPFDALTWNDRCKEQFGLAPNAEVTIDLFYRILHPDDREPTRRAIAEAIENHTVYDVAYRTIHADGEQRWLRAIGRGFYDDSGRPISFDGITIDMTEHKQGEEELRQAKQAAETANAAKDQFLAVLSHELRTPLTPVLASVEVLKDEKLPSSVRPLMEVIHRNVELEARLIDDLLDLTRIIKGKLRLSLESTDVHTLIQNVIDICRPDVGTKQLLLVVDLKATKHYVVADPARIQQVFWNVLKNAIKFTPDGGTITVSSHNQNGSLVVEVVDTGIGIEPDVIGVIFDAFEQGEQTTTRRFGGLGLGLAISKSLVEMHSGSIAVVSEGKDKGATFTVMLPIGEPEPPAERAERTVTPAWNTPTAGNEGIKVLVVDDHNDTVSVLRLLLTRRGFQVFSASTLDLAAKIASQQPFDLIISDIGLPDGTGLDLFRRLELVGPVKAIAVSGFGTTEDMEKSLAAGYALHLVKPFTAQTLHEAIDKLLN